MGQCVTQASRPRTIVFPINFGLGAQVDKSVGTKGLVNYLKRLGLLISYDEVTRYKQSALESSTIESSNRDMRDKALGQWVADNNDRNQVSLTGKENFYRMDVISASPFHMVTVAKKISGVGVVQESFT